MAADDLREATADRQTPDGPAHIQDQSRDSDDATEVTDDVRTTEATSYHHAFVSDEEIEPDTKDSSVEIARKFLLEDNVKSAPIEQQRSFLESKGISTKVIESLLVPKQSVPAQSSPSPASVYTPSSSPPVITYPEFLIRPKNPPLVTPSGLLTTAYVASALGTAIYGLSRFVVQPMFDRLTAARHDMASHTVEQLHTLTDRLVEIATVDPTSTSRALDGQENEMDSTSDPTELFSRDATTQTQTQTQTWTATRSESADSSQTSDDDAATDTGTALGVQSKTLADLQRSLAKLLETTADERESTQGILTQIDEFRQDLDGKIYDSRCFGSSGSIGAGGFDGEYRSRYAGGNKDSAACGGGTSASVNAGNAVAELLGEIRSVKGVLLNMRFSSASLGLNARVAGAV